MTAEEKTFLIEWLDNVPKVPSHYCRKQKAYEGKNFIFPGKTMSNLHSDYVSSCEKAGVRSVCRRFFTDVFKNMNISFHVPRKDQCDTCVAHKHGNADLHGYQEHLDKKKRAQDQKAADKALAGEEVSVWTMDVQSVLTCPSTQASALYYKTKLAIHNMTYFNLKTKEGFCYVFDETQGNVSSQMFGFLHYNHFKNVILKSPGIKKIIVWSDGCGYQNKCTAITNCFLRLCEETGVTIEQKYLVSGHTQMECDSMHSVIEKKLKIDLFEPHDFAIAMKLARQNPQPYEVCEVNHEDIMYLTEDYVKSIRPGKRVGDPTVSDVCGFRYEGGEKPVIKYKLEIDGSWELFPTRICLDVKFWKRLFRKRLSITQRKFEDLQSMKHVMPPHAHIFLMICLISCVFLYIGNFCMFKINWSFALELFCAYIFTVF